MLADSPIKLEHLVYFGLIDHNDVRPLGDVDLDALIAAKVIDASLLRRYEVPELIEAGYLTVGDLVTHDLLNRDDLADLPLADLDLFDLSLSIVDDLETQGTFIMAIRSPWRRCSARPA